MVVPISQEASPLWQFVGNEAFDDLIGVLVKQFLCDLLKTRLAGSHAVLAVEDVAFTATPKGKTIELFGRPGPSGKPEAFHTYSMRQAIDEGFILDVLTNCATYKTFYRFVKNVAEDPEVKKKEAVKVIARMALMHLLMSNRKWRLSSSISIPM